MFPAHGDAFGRICLDACRSPWAVRGESPYTTSQVSGARPLAPALRERARRCGCRGEVHRRLRWQHGSIRSATVSPWDSSASLSAQDTDRAPCRFFAASEVLAGAAHAAEHALPEGVYHGDNPRCIDDRAKLGIRGGTPQSCVVRLICIIRSWVAGFKRIKCPIAGTSW